MFRKWKKEKDLSKIILNYNKKYRNNLTGTVQEPKEENDKTLLNDKKGMTKWTYISGWFNNAKKIHLPTL